MRVFYGFTAASVFVFLSGCAALSSVGEDQASAAPNLVSMPCEAHEKVIRRAHEFGARNFRKTYGQRDDLDGAEAQLFLITEMKMGNFADNYQAAEKDYDRHFQAARIKGCDTQSYPVSPIEAFRQGVKQLKAKGGDEVVEDDSDSITQKDGVLYQCVTRHNGGYESELCLEDPGLFKHWTITLKVNGNHIFSIVEDYSETISLSHKVPPPPALELPLSAGHEPGDTVTIRGQCRPETRGDMETARICTIRVGDTTLIDGVRFDHDVRTAHGDQGKAPD